MEFDEFVVRFARSGDDDSLAAVLSEPFYGVSSELTGLPSVSALETAAEIEPVRKIGSALFEAIARGPLRDAWLETDQRAQARTRGLRFRLQFDLDDPAQKRLFQYPWESLHRPDTRDFLALDPRTPVVRSVGVRRPSNPFRQPSRLRIVVVLAALDSLPDLDLERERLRLIAVATQYPGIDLRFVEAATLEALTAALDANAEPSVLLFCGHSAFSPEVGGYLCLADSQGALRRVDALTLADCCKAEVRPWLVILNACSTAEVSPSLSAEAGLSAALVLAGLPAVIGMRSPVCDDLAIAFSSTLLSSLAKGDVIELALTRARRALYSAVPDGAEWCLPILTLAAGSMAQQVDTKDQHMPPERNLEAKPRPPAAPITNISGFTFTDNESAIGVVQGAVHQTFHRHYGDDAAAMESRAALSERYEELLTTLPEAVRPVVAVGIDLLLGGRYRESKESFDRARRLAGDMPRLSFFEIIAELSGRSFSQLQIHEAGHLLQLLTTARQRDSECHANDFLLAALKLEFYRRYGFVEKPPGPEALLADFARSAHFSPEMNLVRRLVFVSHPELLRLIGPPS